MERLELRVPPPVVTLVSALLMWGLRGAVPSLVWLVPGRAWLAGVLVGTGMMLGLALYVGYLNRFQIGPEERVLEERFGTRFTSYCATVRRWL